MIDRVGFYTVAELGALSGLGGAGPVGFYTVAELDRLSPIAVAPAEPAGGFEHGVEVSPLAHRPSARSQPTDQGAHCENHQYLRPAAQGSRFTKHSTPPLRIAA